MQGFVCTLFGSKRTTHYSDKVPSVFLFCNRCRVCWRYHDSQSAAPLSPSESSGATNKWYDGGVEVDRCVPHFSFLFITGLDTGRDV